jgi:ABC-type phosphate/phosphonate transport system substrate-binding protein
MKKILIASVLVFTAAMVACGGNSTSTEEATIDSLAVGLDTTVVVDTVATEAAPVADTTAQ